MNERYLVNVVSPVPFPGDLFGLENARRMLIRVESQRRLAGLWVQEGGKVVHVEDFKRPTDDFDVFLNLDIADERNLFAGEMLLRQQDGIKVDPFAFHLWDSKSSSKYSLQVSERGPFVLSRNLI